MKIGLVKTNFPGERRVPLLPKDIKDFKNEILVEEGFGKFLDIDDQEYIDKGCHILSRAEVFSESEAIFSLKLIQPTDYPYLREGQMIIGWTHPFGSGRLFMKEQALPKKLIVVDLDSNSPCIYYENEIFESGIPKGLLYKNSFYAGYAGVLDALMLHRVPLVVSQNIPQTSECIIEKQCPSSKKIIQSTTSSSMELKLGKRMIQF